MGCILGFPAWHPGCGHGCRDVGDGDPRRPPIIQGNPGCLDSYIAVLFEAGNPPVPVATPVSSLTYTQVKYAEYITNDWIHEANEIVFRATAAEIIRACWLIIAVFGV
jgi:hypothetical protein